MESAKVRAEQANRGGIDSGIEDIVQVLHKADGFTSSELAKRFDLTQGWARQKIRELFADDKIECVGSREVKRVDGRKSQVPVYRIKKEKNG